MLIQMGYQLTADGQELVYEENINRDAIIETVADLVILYAMLELCLSWLQESKGHGNHFKLKEIIDYCKAGFTHGHILTALTANLQNRHEGSGHILQPIQYRQDSSQYPTGESRNDISVWENDMCTSKTVTPKAQDSRCVVQVKNEHQALRQTSWPDNRSVTSQDDGHTLARSISLEASTGSSGGLSQLDLEIVALHKLTAETSQSAEPDLVWAPREFSSTANKIRTIVASHWECSYCMFLNPTASDVCEVCKKNH